MPLKEIGVILLVLMAVVILGNVWFHLVEWVLGRIRGLLSRKKDPTAWHPLPPEREDQEDSRS